MSGKAGNDGPNTSPVIHTKDKEEDHGFRLKPDPFLDIVDIWGAEHVDGRSLYVFVPLFAQNQKQ